MVDNKNNNLDSKDFSLALQKWDSYILKQHQKGDELQDLEQTLYFSKKNFIRYFSTITALVNRNSSYIGDYKTMKADLDELKKDIVCKEFIDSAIKDGIKMKNMNVDFVTPDEEYMKKVDKVTEIFKQIQMDFTIRKINPEVIELPKNDPKGGKELEF